MKTKLTFALIMIIGTIIIGCKQNEQKVEVEEVKIDLINEEFPDATAEVLALMDELKQTVYEIDIDKLIAFHAYGPKFTDFKNGDPRNGGKENEEYERDLLSNVTEVLKFDYDDLKIAVYDNVANVTFHSDFHFKFGEDEAVAKDQVTLLAVKTENGWKFVHEHHSPLKKEEN